MIALEGAEKLESMYLGIDWDGFSFQTCGEILLFGGGSHWTGMNKGNRAGARGYRALWNNAHVW